jgi:hypothetical protein
LADFSSNCRSTGQLTCYNFLHGFKDSTFGAPGPAAQAVNSENGREQWRWNEPRVTRRKRPGFNLGTRRRGAAAIRRTLWTEAHQARRLPCTAPQVTGRCGPAVSRCRARQHHDQADSIAASAPEAVKMSQPTDPNAAHYRAGPSSVNETRRSFLTAPQKRSSGPTLERRTPPPAQRA